jgi:hypothetical protein
MMSSRVGLALSMAGTARLRITVATLIPNSWISMGNKMHGT